MRLTTVRPWKQPRNARELRLPVGRGFATVLVDGAPVAFRRIESDAIGLKERYQCSIDLDRASEIEVYRRLPPASHENR